MTTELILLIVSVVVFAAMILLLFYILRRQQSLHDAMQDDLRRALSDLRRELNEGVQSSVSHLGRMIMEQQRTSDAQGETRFKTFEQGNEQRLKSFEYNNEQKLEAIRQTIERRLLALQTENTQKLDEMRMVVDEKLQKTLESKIAQSFQLVNERLEQVHKGLGEMQTLANGVGDLKKVLSNVKTRGMLGEIQLGAILEEILAPEQYMTNAVTKVGSSDRVEYAVKLPTDDGAPVYLPIDSKFPADLYSNLQDAYEAGSPEAIAASILLLTQRIRQEAAKIRDKYIDPPNTTDFAIMFLPFEGLYAEVVNRGLVEDLQRSYRVNIAGPSTMAALLNSLQMGFRSFAIQKRSSEVWRVLGAVKTEFQKFGNVLASSRKRLQQVDDDLEQLIGTRTRAITRNLRAVEQLDERSTTMVIGALADGDADESETTEE
ncbi:MAG: DNA recombination protein RmuC [Firmicutes bacterium HGW-Firmicutes-9]|jgi:DNA recombination protein RmuC|nr:MAG: DNA recombination protein RmuC [Firmicutes bacterium HGW-Firmicutes-9]